MRAVKVILMGCLAGLLAGRLIGCGKSDSGKDDLSDPKKAAMVFAGALESGDVERAKNVSLAGGVEVELVEMMAKATHDLKHLADVARAKFGEAGAEIMARRGPINATTYLADAEVEITGNTARVIARSGVSIIPMKFVDNKNWKVDIGAMSVGQDIIEAVSVLRVVDEVAKSVTAGIESGKLATPEAARAELETTIAAKLGRTQATQTTTQPATRSTTQLSTQQPAAPMSAPRFDRPYIRLADNALHN